jgi:AhpC/TSA antioxidant enzyme
VSDRLEEFSGAAVVLITFTRSRNLPGFRRRLGLAYPVLADEARAAYRAYGLGRGAWWRVWGLQTLGTYRRLVQAGKRLRPPTQDTLQLGGDFIIDATGLVAYTYRSTRPDDRPPVNDLITAVRACDRGDINP